jgi:phosphoserine phosphatase
MPTPGLLRRLAVAFAACALAAAAWAQPLPSWNEGPAKQAIVRFVTDVTAAGAPTFVPPEERVAVFDNDGTLWAEQPMYFQLAFMLDMARKAAEANPKLRDDPVVKTLLANDMKALAAMDHKAIGKVLAATNTGMSAAEYDRAIRAWLATAKHPRFGRLYTELTYVPMVELLEYLRANGFKTYIVSGGGIQFMRPWTEKAYGIPPEQVIGSVAEVKLETVGGRPVLMREPKVAFVDDGPGKPVGIYRGIGRQPILAFGNSDGDLPMLQWTAAGSGPRFMGIVHHTDGAREYAYNRNSKVGKLDKALSEAVARGWTVVDMKNDWKRVFAFQ